QEMSGPVLTPAELWKQTGRYGSTEIFKFKDRNGRDYVLPLTHEETFAFHASELQSYRQLPQLWYHFQTKDRDEPRPRGGLLRVREFIMKDSYSFDRDEAGLDISFEKNRGAYERIFERCGIEAVAVQAEPGMMGGSESLDYLSPSGSGENVLGTCENGDYAADAGSLGPVGFKGRVVADETLREGQFVAGANRTGWHLRGVELGRDFEADVADLRVPREGDRCPSCGGALRFQTAIEVGHIFKL